MSLFDLIRFSTKALSGHRLRTGLSLLGVMIGVSAVVMLTALGEGARRYVIGEFASLGTNLVIIFPGKTTTSGSMPGIGGIPNDLTLDDAEALRRGMRKARHVAPMTMNNEIVAYEERSRQIPVIGATHEMLIVRDLRIERGEFLPPGEESRRSPVAVIGKKAAKELFRDEEPLGKVVRVGAWRMRIIGVLGARGTQLGINMDDIIMVPVATTMKMFNVTSLFRIIIQVSASSELDAVSERASAILTERHSEEDITCLTQDAVIDSFSSILTALTLALGGIAAISLSVSGIGIMNVMLVSVSERTSEIGLLRALGVKKHQVLAVFLAEAIILSTAGGPAGQGAGWLAAKMFTQIYPSFPVVPPVWAVVSAITVSVGVGGVFGVIPAINATRLDPSQALAGR